MTLLIFFLKFLKIGKIIRVIIKAFFLVVVVAAFIRVSGTKLSFPKPSTLKDAVTSLEVIL